MAKLFIKNMVCNRCIMAVRGVMERLGLEVERIKLGEVALAREPMGAEKPALQEALAQLGFELIGDKKSQTIERIKTVIIRLVHHPSSEAKHNLSEILAKELRQDYSHLSNLFSGVEGITIEKYFIAQRIEKVKELLVYDELSLGEIAFRLNYSSPAYLSNQFKKVTGLTPSHFKRVKEKKRKPLDKVP